MLKNRHDHQIVKDFWQWKVHKSVEMSPWVMLIFSLFLSRLYSYYFSLSEFRYECQVWSKFKNWACALCLTLVTPSPPPLPPPIFYTDALKKEQQMGQMS